MVYTENIEFDWDSKKAQANFEKHGVTFEEAIFVFYDPAALTLPDHKHSFIEIRETIIGLVGSKTIIISFTKRSIGIYRIINARKTNEKEKKKYAENRLLRHP